LNQDNQYFSEEVPFEIREDILRRNASANMSDIERAAFFGLPDGCRIRENAKIISKENLNIGKHCWVGEGVLLDASGGLDIGNNVSIGINCLIYTHDSHKLNIMGCNTRRNSKEIIRKKTTIGSNCFIGSGSVILPGVNIGNRVIIQALSLVDCDIPNGTVFSPNNKYKEYENRINELEEKLEKLLTKNS
jgi:acetyltransferase-like isoleucine patch superfamily enzyme